MRIIGGSWRGRTIASPPGSSTRPTSDRAREGLFSALLSRVGSFEDMDVLDLYAGSGALGLEALSRGAATATFVESDRRVADVLRRTIASLGDDERRTRVIVARVESERVARSVQRPVSLLFADPPYRIDAASVRQVLEGLVRDGCVAADALVAYEHRTGVRAIWPEGFVPETVLTYGDTSFSLAWAPPNEQGVV